MGVFGNDPINAEETGVGGVRELLRHPLRACLVKVRVRMVLYTFSYEKAVSD
jgi:hypothetical protein